MKNNSNVSQPNNISANNSAVGAVNGTNNQNIAAQNSDQNS